MAVGKIKMRRAGPIRELKNRVKSGGGDFFLTVKADSELSVRFTTEPTEWVEFQQHFMTDHEPKAFPCNDGDCEGCDAGDKPSTKWAACVLDITADKIRVLLMSRTVIDQLLRRFDKYKTVMDRDYEIIREGSGPQDTKYDVSSEGRSKRSLVKYRAQLLGQAGIEEMIAGMLDDKPDDDDGEDAPEDDFPAAKKSKRPIKRAGVRRARYADEEEDDAPPPRRRAVKSAPRPVAKKAAAKKSTGRRMR